MRLSMVTFELLVEQYIDQLDDEIPSSEVAAFVRMIMSEEQRVYEFALGLLAKYAAQRRTTCTHESQDGCE